MTRPAPARPQTAELNSITLSYTDAGSGPLVVMIMGTGSPGRVWHAHQQPALLAAGYRVVTFDNRGIAPSSESADGFTMADMVADTAALIEHLGGPARVVGTSLGARIAQELTLARPDLVVGAAMLATYGRITPLVAAFSAGELELIDAGTTLPDCYYAAITAESNLSPASLRDDRAARDWLDIIGFSGQQRTAGVRAQMALPERDENRLAAYRAISRPAMVVGFADDRTLPVHLAREVAEAIPGARYEEIPDAGHWGYLEQPERVNALLVDFLGSLPR
ncbi:alpha/beta fold hydrolase [Gordonia sp. VNK21]|uniref:alpha/beta fold hydrolase n=1 Tax=Gordonia sp. VNK21 TaxID=3382483 RepID=UPI0038D47FDE